MAFAMAKYHYEWQDLDRPAPGESLFPSRCVTSYISSPEIRWSSKAVAIKLRCAPSAPKSRSRRNTASGCIRVKQPTSPSSTLLIVCARIDFFDTSVLVAAFWGGPPHHQPSVKLFASASPKQSAC